MGVLCITRVYVKPTAAITRAGNMIYLAVKDLREMAIAINNSFYNDILQSGQKAALTQQQRPTMYLRLPASLVTVDRGGTTARQTKREAKGRTSPVQGKALSPGAQLAELLLEHQHLPIIQSILREEIDARKGIQTLASVMSLLK
ncbi:hypothetical protein CLAFUR4_03911 [Fulvia fulva]|nr:hypothetical protein CLAFUR4_03911 [Fulvia fulva]WPV26448.1 hypothetical protein CLAFUW7_03914 [Fulvia fulva]